MEKADLEGGKYLRLADLRRRKEGDHFIVHTHEEEEEEGERREVCEGSERGRENI